jgi:hypothetical protein
MDYLVEAKQVCSEAVDSKDFFENNIISALNRDMYILRDAQQELPRAIMWVEANPSMTNQEYLDKLKQKISSLQEAIDYLFKEYRSRHFSKNECEG